jgi:hypothetical protein
MTQELQEIFDELAGKLEYDAGLPRNRAEATARKMMEETYGTDERYKRFYDLRRIRS